MAPVRESAANDRAGAKTQVALLLMAVLIALTSVSLMPIFENLPLAILGAIVISAVMGFINVPAMRAESDIPKGQLRLRAAGIDWCAGAGRLPGLLLSIVLSILLLLGRESRPSGSVLGNLPGTRAFVDAEESRRQKSS